MKAFVVVNKVLVITPGHDVLVSGKRRGSLRVFVLFSSLFSYRLVRRCFRVAMKHRTGCILVQIVLLCFCYVPSIYIIGDFYAVGRVQVGRTTSLFRESVLDYLGLRLVLRLHRTCCCCIPSIYAFRNSSKSVCHVDRFGKRRAYSGTRASCSGRWKPGPHNPWKLDSPLCLG